MKTRLIAIALIVSIGAFLSAHAQERGYNKPDGEGVSGGTITDGGISFSYGGFSSTAPFANFVLPGGSFGDDRLFQWGWYYRIEGAGSETSFGTPTSESYAGNELALTWNNLGGALSASEFTEVVETAAGEGYINSILVIGNFSGSSQTVNLFHYADIEASGDSVLDSATLTNSPDFITVTDFETIEYRAFNNNAYQVDAWPVVVNLLDDAAVTDFANSGLPFGPADFGGGFQWVEAVIPPDSTIVIGASLGVRAASPQPGPADSDVANFAVNKTFDDGNPAEVEVTLSCNTGLPLEQSTTISEGDGVVFVVGDFNDGEMDCEVTESAGVDGYTVEYSGGLGASDTSCEFNGVVSGVPYVCNISNTLEEVEVEVAKIWIDENPQFNAINTADALWECSNVAGGGDDDGSLDFFGNPGEDFFTVFPNWDGGTDCSVTEVLVPDSGVEVDDSDCQGLVVFPGSGTSCIIVNTRLYEGIPTLSQYGLAVLALLMLGVGFVAFRRLV